MHEKAFLILADPYKQFVLLWQLPRWGQQVPVLPCTSSEIKQLTRQTYLRGERRTLDRLGDMDSESASTISYLNLTREAANEALSQLRDERPRQVTSLSGKLATRYRIITKEGLVTTTCPRPRCGRRDSFWRLLSCYDLMTSAECGAFVAPFLVYMARKVHATCPSYPWIKADQSRP